jgi:hypothetical protein
MEARAKKPHRSIRAFTGLIFVSYEWRHVPDGNEEEAKRLEDGGYLEVKRDPPPAVVSPEPSGLQAMTVPNLRVLARELDISYAGLKKADLIAAIEEEE